MKKKKVVQVFEFIGVPHSQEYLKCISEGYELHSKRLLLDENGKYFIEYIFVKEDEK